MHPTFVGGVVQLLWQRWCHAGIGCLPHSQEHKVHSTALQRLRDWAGVQKAKGQPIVRIAAPGAAQGAAHIFRFATVEDRETFLAVMNPLKDAAVRARGPVATGKPGVVPSAEVQAKVFEARPELKALHTRCAPPGAS
jgi:hypothetical protein